MRYFLSIKLTKNVVMSDSPCPILFLIRELDYGGTEQQLTETVTGLNPDRFSPHVGCFLDRGLQSQELRRRGFPIAQFPVTSFRTPAIIGHAREFGQYVSKHHIRIVHTFDVPSNLFGVFAAKAYRVPVIISSQRAQRDLVDPLTRFLLRRTDRLVNAIVVNSMAVQRELVQKDHVPQHLLHLVYNGLNTDRFYPGQRARPENLRDASMVIGAVCSFRPEKDLSTLLEAFAQIRREYSGLRLVLVGDGPSMGSLKQQAGTLGIAGVTSFHPVTHDVPTWLKAIDIFVLPSIAEALSNSIMEAMACGCTVVASNVGGNPELVLEGQTGLLFEPRDTAGLVSRLKLLLDSPALRERLSRAGSERLRSQFSREIAVSRMEALYTRLMIGSRVSA